MEEAQKTLEEVEVEEKERIPGKYYCKYCGAGPFDTPTELANHVKYRCEEKKKVDKMKEEDKKRKSGEMYKGETDMNAILEEILRKHRDISDSVADEVMEWARLKGCLQPLEVQSILQSMKGISSSTAYIVASKYALALQKAQQEGRLQLPFNLMVPQPPQTMQMFPSTVQPQLPQPILQPQLQPQFQITQPPSMAATQFQQPTPSTGFQLSIPQQYDIRSIVRDEIRAFEDRIRSIEAKIDRIVSQPQVQAPETAEYVEIEEPLKDSEGKIIIGPDDKPIVRRIKMPVSQAKTYIGGEDVELKILDKMEKYKKIFGVEGKTVSIDDIRKIIKEELEGKIEGKGKVNIEEAIERAIEKYAKKVEEEKLLEKKFSEIESRFKELEESIKSEIAGRQIEGYKEDSYRVIGQSISELTSLLRERKPLEIIIREGIPSLVGGKPPVEKEVVGTSKSLIEELEKRGWVVER